MAVGYVLITTDAGKEHQVYVELRKIKEIEDLNPLFGEYDIIAKVNAPSVDDIGMIVVQKIREIDGIRDTKTLTGISF